MRWAATLLSGEGALVDEAARPALRFEDAFETFALLNHAIVAHSLPPKVRIRLQQGASSFPPGDLSHRALQARGARMTPGLYQQVKARKQRLEAAFARFFQRFDVILCPPAPVTAIPHDHRPGVHARTLRVDGTERPYLDFLVWACLATVADLPGRRRPGRPRRAGPPRRRADRRREGRGPHGGRGGGNARSARLPVRAAGAGGDLRGPGMTRRRWVDKDGLVQGLG